MEKEAIGQLLNSANVEDNILGIIIADRLGMDMYTGQVGVHSGVYEGMYERAHQSSMMEVFGIVILNGRLYWVNHIGIYKARIGEHNVLLPTKSPILYNDGSIKGHP